MYLAGGSVGLLLIVWSALAMKDHAGSAATGAQTSVAPIPPTAAVATPQVLIPPTPAPDPTQSTLITPTPLVTTPQPALVPPAAPDASQQPTAASSNSSSGGSTAEPQVTAEPTATPSPRPTQKPQTPFAGFVTPFETSTLQEGIDGEDHH